ncbi:MAG: hypothetical protein M1840_001974 [Geoglossum simile]|nr:MAG: hypothetical protein M1840_001974 [Geoglossum simile]
MYVKNLVEYLQTNLTMTKKRYTHGRHHIQLALFCQLAGFSGNCPQALFNLQYRDIVVTLLRDPNGGPHRILIEFTCEFTKQFLGVKDANKFPLPEIIFDPSFILSPHLKLLLKPSILDVPVFRKSVRTGYRYKISPSEPLSYVTLLSLMKAVGVITGFLQPMHPYCLRYSAGNEFNQNGDVSNALQNMMLQHANIDTFIKHYLPRRVTADVRAIVSGYEPQKDLMRATCRMTRWIDPNHPQNLMREQSQSIDKHRQLLPGYRSLCSDIVNLRQQLRATLLKKLRDQWDVENPVNEVKLQLSGLKFSDNRGTKVQVVDEMPLIQKCLVETVMTMLDTTVEEEFHQCNAAIDAVATYCHFQEGGAIAMPRRRPLTRAKGACLQLVAADAEKQVLSAAMLLVFTEKRPTICFVCLREASLLFKKRVYSFASPGDLTKHFKRKHLSNIRGGDWIGCKFEGNEAEEVKGALRRKQKMSETDNNRAGKTLKLFEAAFDDNKNVQEPQDKTKTFLQVQDDNVEITQNSYPIVFTYPVCFICIGNEQLLYTERIHPFKWKYTLQKHLNTCIQQGVFSEPFECKHAH